MLRNLVVFVVVVVLLLAQAPQAVNTVRSLFDSGDWPWWRQDAVTAPERAQELASKGLREQLISFNEGMTGIEYRYNAKPETQHYNIYAIGVGQITLNDPESTKTEKVTVTGSRLTAPKQSADSLPTAPIEGQFNNVLIFDRRTGEITKLFDTRVSISQFQYGWRTNPEVLIIFATDRDSDKNGTLDNGDVHDIYVYTFADRKMHKVATSNINPTEIVDIPDVGFVVVKAVVDHNRDGYVSEYGDYGNGRQKKEPEPRTLLRVDLKTFAASPFVSGAMQDELQAILDGPKPVGQPDKTTAPGPK